MSELKKCPFCGGDPETDVRVNKWKNNKGEAEMIVKIYCKNCYTDKKVYFNYEGSAPISVFTDAFAEVEKQWNMRIGN